jgi:hypothetical protein
MAAKYLHVSRNHNNNLQRSLLLAHHSEAVGVDVSSFSDHVDSCLLSSRRTHCDLRVCLRLHQTEVRSAHGRMFLSHNRLCNSLQHEERPSGNEILRCVSYDRGWILSPDHRHRLAE